MELQKIIVPSEKRVIVYTILHGEIVNQIQKQEHSVDFKEDLTKIQEKKIECISLTTNKENLYSFIYVHANGEIETEINVVRPKFAFHEKYNDSL
jgi:hypothetical protein